MTYRLTYEEIGQVKEMLWDGNMSQQDIGARFFMSQATISRIKAGFLGSDVPWPDETLGAMSNSRMRSIKEARFSSAGRRPIHEQPIPSAEAQAMAPLVEAEVERIKKQREKDLIAAIQKV